MRAYHILLHIALIFCTSSSVLAEECSDSYFSNQNASAAASCDFIQYWSAAKILLEASNPYDAQILSAIQEEQGKKDPFPTMMWNPPWVAFLMSPFALLDYSTAIQWWFVFNLILFVSTLLFCFRSCIRLCTLPIILLSIVSLPLVSSFHFAQIGLLLMCGAIFAVEGFERKSPFLLFIGILLLSMKFHLFLIFFAALIAGISKRFPLPYLRLIGGALLIVFLIPEVISPGVTKDWFEALTVQQPNLPTTIDWKSASFTTALRLLFPQNTTFLKPNIVGLVVLIFSLIYFAYLRIRNVTISKELLYDSLVLSFLISPYNWLFDFSVLLPIQWFLVAEYYRSKTKLTKATVLLFIALQLATILFAHITLASQHQFFWFPWCFAAIWFWYRQRVKS